MIGAATTVGKVEDERIKRIQLRSAMKVAVLLLLASVASGVAVWLVPCPRVFEGAVMH
jgi:predicted DNA-binding ribbon-helix-helix protein